MEVEREGGGGGGGRLVFYFHSAGTVTSMRIEKEREREFVGCLTLTELKSHLALFYWLNHLSMKEGRKPEYPEKAPDDELQKMPHTKARKFSRQPRLEPAL